MVLPTNATRSPHPAAIDMPNTKPSNPKQAYGDKKAPLSCISNPVMYELGLAMLEGALKYGRHNYRAVGVRYSTYYDATLRHLTAWWEGEDIDPDSGVHHLIKAMACINVVRDSMIFGNATDDRPPKAPADWQLKVNNMACALVAKYPEPKAPVTQIDWLWAKEAAAAGENFTKADVAGATRKQQYVCECHKKMGNDFWLLPASHCLRPDGKCAHNPVDE